jgi:hypothetical protein
MITFYDTYAISAEINTQTLTQEKDDDMNAFQCIRQIV